MSQNDDIEHTVRLDYNKIKDPYDAIDVPEDSVDFDKLNAELESISADFSEQPQDDADMKTIRFDQLPDDDANSDTSSEISSDIDFDFDALIGTETDPDFKPNSDFNIGTDTSTNIDSLVTPEIDDLIASEPSLDTSSNIDAEMDFQADSDSSTDTGSLTASDTSFDDKADIDSNESEITEYAMEHPAQADKSKQLPLTSEAEHVDLTSEMMVEKEAVQADSSHIIKDEPETVLPAAQKNPLAAIIATCGLIAGLIGIGFGISAQQQTSEVAGQLSLVKVNAEVVDYSNELIDIHEQIDQLTSQLNALESRSQALPNQAEEVITISEAVLPIAHDNPAKIIEPQTPMNNVSTPASKPASKAVTESDSWNVIISSHDELSKAKIQQQRLLPMLTEIQPALVNNKTWYRTVATGFASKPEAVTFINKLKKEGVPDAWLQHQVKGK